MSENRENIIYSPTFYLFALPSFWEGCARLMDFGNILNEYNESPNVHIADSIALFNDWLAVGYDLRNAMSQIPLNEQIEAEA